MEEIERRQVSIRDILIHLISSKEYSQLRGSEGLSRFKMEVKETLNNVLMGRPVNEVLITEFLYN